ncbi:hypothetical protein BKA93DRAFT_798986, partial [Sparassis latifolia]
LITRATTSFTIESPYATPSVAPFHPIYFLAIHAFASVTDLRLFHVEFRTFLDFARLVSSFPNLLAVEFWNVSWLRHGSNQFALDCYRSRFQWNDLVIDDVELTGLAQLLRAVGSSLQHLTFRADNEWMESFVSEEGLSMVHLTSLRSLQIPIRLDRTDFGSIEELLSRHICSQVMCSLTFSFHYGYNATPLDGAKDVLLRMERAGIEDVSVLPARAGDLPVLFRRRYRRPREKLGAGFSLCNAQIARARDCKGRIYEVRRVVCGEIDMIFSATSPHMY